MDPQYASLVIQARYPEYAPLPKPLQTLIAQAEAVRDAVRTDYWPDWQNMKPADIPAEIEKIAVDSAASDSWTQAKSSMARAIASRLTACAFESGTAILSRQLDDYTKAWRDFRAAIDGLPSPTGFGSPNTPLKTMTASELLVAGCGELWTKAVESAATIERTIEFCKLEASIPNSNQGEYDDVLSVFGGDIQTAGEWRTLDSAPQLYEGINAKLAYAAIQARLGKRIISVKPILGREIPELRQRLNALEIETARRRRDADEQDARTPDGQRRIIQRAEAQRAIREGLEFEARKAAAQRGDQ
jgi:hypothetical protein